MQPKRQGTYFYNHLFRAKFHAPDVDLSGRVAVVTGGNTGVGYATVVHLLQRNISHVIVACRSVEKGEAAKEKMLAAMSDCEQSRISVWKLDLASFESVRTFAGRLNTELERLDILILNAGLSTEAWRMSVDGYEESLQVNAIATGFLSLLAAPVLQCTAARHIEAKPHLAIVVSEGHDWVNPFSVSKSEGSIIAALNDKAQHDPGDRYMITKLLGLYIGRELSRLPAFKDIVVNCPTPGYCSSGLFREQSSLVQGFLGSFGWHPEKGARTLVYAATIETTPGAFLWYCREQSPSKEWVTSANGDRLQKKAFAEMSDIWAQLEPRLAPMLAV